MLYHEEWLVQPTVEFRRYNGGFIATAAGSASSSFNSVSIGASSHKGQKGERKKMKATVKGRYEVNKSAASATLALHAGDARLKASVTEATFANGPSLEDLVLSLEKHGAFILDYNVADKAN
ncbi:hypothetical protein ZIOFF_046199 [Zingiber officinale]|uniref:Uncharacterized protein n=1 Tax=Zingiber officinale TaxID=94328 RepID=A0A8J5GDY4_ZINOF|nr:hypothetical protein ZIOFF_046199 [Zingiber officinale]